MSQIVRPTLFCVTRGDDEIIARPHENGLELLSDIEVHGRGAPHQELKAGAGVDTNAHRLELIQSVRDGKHLELVVKRARTYRQSKGYKNRNFLRFAADKLESIAPTFAGQPFLVDHNTYEQDKRKGTILSGESEVDGRGMTSFFHSFSVVKPDAVISVLDGTIDRFSIGWFRTGAVMCTAHGVDIRGKDSCYCWPGDQVEVDGKQLIAEYEYQDAAGKELSAVNVPAVTGTRIEEYRAALSAELEIPTRRPRTMMFKRLAAALKLTALTEADEDRAVATIEGLSERALNAEVRLREVSAELATVTTERDRLRGEVEIANAGALNALIEDAYKAGKLGYGKDGAGKNTPDPLESMLRDLGVSKGREALAAKITAMRVTIPIGHRVLTEQIEHPTDDRQLHADQTDAEMVKVANQLGVPVERMRERRALMNGGR